MLINLLIFVESVLSGAFIFKGRDGCYRDLAGVHGSYRKVEETLPAIGLIGQALDELRVSSTTWLIDRPVSNSGRLKTLLAEAAERNSWRWHIELQYNPDYVLKEANAPVVTTDGPVLNEVGDWVNLGAYFLSYHSNIEHIIDLS